ncbi:MAG TPA: hypothetical protein VKY73_06295 [Polyangiaceae bacterium]|nr:hypothetical protein [Polyangiaceae bacterium]
MSAPVYAQDDDRKKDEKTGTGTSMDTGDPAYTETSDEGPYKPGGVTKKKKGDAAPKVRRGKKEKFQPRPRDPFVVFLEPLVGFGSTRLPGPVTESSTGDATLLAFQAGGRYDLTPKLSLGLELGWSTASVETTPGASVSATAFANPVILGEYRHSLSLATTLPLFAGLGIPIGQGDPSPGTTDTVGARQAGINALADAAHGLLEPELYQPERLPILLGVGLRHEMKGLELHAWTKFVFGINVGGDLQDPSYFPTGTLNLNTVAIRNVTLVGLTVDVLEKPELWAGVDAWLATRLIDPIEFESGATQPSDLQFVIEPRIGARFGKIRPSLGFILPLGGQAGDIWAIRLHADYAF